MECIILLPKGSTKTVGLAVDKTITKQQLRWRKLKKIVVECRGDITTYIW